LKVNLVTDFSELGLEPRLLSALANEGYTNPTPIQAQAIPHVLGGRDLLGIAQTGTGKTASFALPILQILSGNKRTPAPKSARALILSPTRELSAQIADSFRAYGRNMNETVTTIFGGVSEGPQKQTMAKGIDILVATPGRLLDLVSQRAVDLSKVEIFVLDEADRMLDMGFIRDIRRLITYLPKVRQNLFFSATMPEEIGSLAGDLLKDPVSVSVTPAATTVERIAQRVIHVDNASKRALLIELLNKHDDMQRTLVFTRTKHGADKVVRALSAAGIVSSAIHGNKSQSQRVQTMNAFRSGRTRVLIATDIAARGIDVDGITHVINYDLPHVPESYVHRIGRTARAGADGIAIAFCDREERSLLRDIEKVTRQTIPSSEWKARPGEVQAVDAAGREHAETERAERRERKPHRDRKPHSDRKPHRERKPHGDRRPHGERHAHGEQRAQGHGKPHHPQHAAQHEQQHGERAQHGERKQHGEHRTQAHSKPRHPQHADRRPGQPQAKQHGDRPQHGERPKHAEGHRPHKGPKPHRKGQGHKPAHGGAIVRDGGGNALPRFLQHRAR
jgi:ATP-dependent RNA helicase RhlE